MLRIGYLSFFSMIFLMQGCVNQPAKPGHPDFTPIPPQSMQAPQPITGSIYNSASSINLYGDGRAHRVGDILTINLTESTQSSKSAKTALDKNTAIGLKQPSVMGGGVSVFGAPLEVTVPSSTTAFAGEGTSDMSNSLSGSITVSVHEVLPNGVLLVRGEKWLTLNQGDEYIRLSGLVRPQDIGADNTLSSNKLADARITYSGTGSVTDTNVMGWVSKFFISALMPF